MDIYPKSRGRGEVVIVALQKLLTVAVVSWREKLVCSRGESTKAILRGGQMDSRCSVCRQADVDASDQVQHLLAVDGRIEGEIKAFQSFGGVARRPFDVQNELLLGATFHFVFEQACEKGDVRPLAVNGLLIAGRDQDAGEAQTFKVGDELMRHFHRHPPTRWPTSSAMVQTKAWAGGKALSGGGCC